MDILVNQILEHKEAAALPSLLESGGLPALISGLSPVHRANLAAALENKLELPLVVVCPDDTAAESFARDLEAMLGREVDSLIMRDWVFYPAEAVSRQAEQKRLATSTAWLRARPGYSPPPSPPSSSAACPRRPCWGPPW